MSTSRRRLSKNHWKKRKNKKEKEFMMRMETKKRRTYRSRKR
jgi:hypothetical protein